MAECTATSDDEEWVVVNRKSKQRISCQKNSPTGKTPVYNSIPPIPVVDCDINAALQNVTNRMAELERSPFCKAFSEKLHSINSQDESRKFVKIVCLGVGSPTQSRASAWQTALALLAIKTLDLARITGPGCAIFSDPVLTDLDVLLLLKSFSFVTFTGKSALEYSNSIPSASGGLTLYFMPHCEKELYGRIIKNNSATNWSTQLASCVIFGNDLRYQLVSGGSVSGFIAKRSHFADVVDEATKWCEISPIKQKFAKRDVVFNDLAFITFNKMLMPSVAPFDSVL